MFCPQCYIMYVNHKPWMHSAEYPQKQLKFGFLEDNANSMYCKDKKFKSVRKKMVTEES